MSKRSMMLRAGLTSGVLALAALAAPRGAAAQADGAQVYSTRCAACHQADAKGVGDMFPPLSGSEWVTGDPGRAIRIVLHGLEGEVEVKGETFAGVMPGWGGALNDAEVAAVLTYARSNFGNSAGAVTAAQVAAIRAAESARKKPWTVKELVLATAKANNK